ncbi:MAG: hypothetical protein GX495_06215 [Chloroflexi bacterium]|jgi:hypothetical protein|nr:hypothetical protein [Chloroflexota bacterium]
MEAFDRYVQGNLKAWARSHRPSRNGRALLLQAASHHPAEQARQNQKPVDRSLRSEKRRDPAAMLYPYPFAWGMSIQNLLR